MLIRNTLLAAETIAEEGFKMTLKDYILEFLYEGSGTQYENFSFGNPLATYRMIIIAIALGLIIATVAVFVGCKVSGELVRRLYAEKAFSPDKAKTLAELGLGSRRALRHSLRHGSLKRMIGCTERDKHNDMMLEAIEGKVGESTTDGANGKKIAKKQDKKPIIADYIPHPEKDSYYLPEDKAESLQKLFSEKGNGIPSLILTVVLCILGSALLFELVPSMLKFLDVML